MSKAAETIEDTTMMERINELASEEHGLFERESQGTVTIADRDRLNELQTMLDQCWDLLRQRRARREFGLDPDQAELRDEKTIKAYSSAA